MPHEFDIWCTCGLAVMSFSFLCVLTITLHFLVESTRNFGCNGLLRNPLAIFSALTMILSVIYVAIDCSRIYNGFVHRRINVNAWKIDLIIANDIIYYASNLLLYIALILRLRATPQLSSYDGRRLPRKQLIVLAFLLFCDIIAIGVFIFSIYGAIADYDSNFITNSDGTRLILSVIVLITNDLLINGILLYMFLNKLYYQVYYLEESLQENRLVTGRIKTLAQSNIDTMSLTGREEMSSDLLNRTQNEQEEIVDLMTKISLLTILCVIFAQFWNVAALYTDYNLAERNISDLWYSEHVILCVSFRSIEAVANGIGLHFTFFFNNSIYLKCCGNCHDCLKNACIKCIVQKNLEKILIHQNNRDHENHHDQDNHQLQQKNQEQEHNQKQMNEGFELL